MQPTRPPNPPQTIIPNPTYHLPFYQRYINPFQQMNNMNQQFMSTFNGIGLRNNFFQNSMQSFGNNMMIPDMFQFSNMHQNLHNNQSQGTFVSKSFMSSTRIGPDGKAYTEKYFENELGQNQNGNTISEKQQAYKNSEGIKRIAEQRMLNDTGRKIIKEKNQQGYEETKHYYNIEQEDANKFDQQWNQVNNEQKFLENHGQYLGYNNNGQMIMMNSVPRQQYQNLPNQQIQYPYQQQTQYQQIQYPYQQYQQSQQYQYPQYGIQSQSTSNYQQIPSNYQQTPFQSNYIPNPQMYQNTGFSQPNQNIIIGKPIQPIQQPNITATIRNTDSKINNLNLKK